jgi:2-oxoglutarate ferredoxin oxidoreductase subunit beta
VTTVDIHNATDVARDAAADIPPGVVGDAAVGLSEESAPADRSPIGSLTLVPRSDEKQSAKSFRSDQDVRWCPGCGDYAILAAVQSFLPELGIRRENIVFVSGIGCSSRFPYYMNTYGMHSIHGRAPAIATGLATARPDLSVWVITGDGDGLSIGGNHLIHALRRNVNLKILLFNNRIYGLTKGQYSPTSEIGKITKSTPYGSVDQPFNPLSLALGAEASFVARTLDSDRHHIHSVLAAAAEHRGSAFIEVFQNCPIFNDGAFDAVKDSTIRDEVLLPLQAGQPLRFGAELQNGIVAGPDGSLRVTSADDPAVVVHDPTLPDPSRAFALSRLDGRDGRPVPVGVLRSVSRPSYDDQVAGQLAEARAAGDPGDRDLQELLYGKDTWTVR